MQVINPSFKARVERLAINVMHIRSHGCEREGQTMERTLPRKVTRADRYLTSSPHLQASPWRLTDGHATGDHALPSGMLHSNPPFNLLWLLQRHPTRSRLGFSPRTDSSGRKCSPEPKRPTPRRSFSGVSNSAVYSCRSVAWSSRLGVVLLHRWRWMCQGCAVDAGE